MIDDVREREVRIVHLTGATDDALAVLHEYYEAVNVVLRDEPGDVQAIIDDAASGVWLAYLDDEVVGCVVLRRLTTIAGAGECKRLYVKAAARGRRIADALLDAQEQFARDAGLECIYLDSYDDLEAAITLYRRRGYVPCERYNDNPQATIFNAQANRLVSKTSPASRTEDLHFDDACGAPRPTDKQPPTRQIYLDSYDDLEVAIALYRRRGYVSCERHNDNPQAHAAWRSACKPSARSPGGVCSSDESAVGYDVDSGEHELQERLRHAADVLRKDRPIESYDLRNIRHRVGV